MSKYICPICKNNCFQLLEDNIYTPLNIQYKISWCQHCKIAHTFTSNSNKDKKFPIDISSKYVSPFYQIIMRYFMFLRVRKIRAILRCQSLQGKRILDIGGGSGGFAQALASYGAEVTVIEPQKIYRQLISKNSNVNYIHSTFNNTIAHTLMKGKKFDIVTFWHSFEHLNNPLSVLKLVRPLLRVGGFVYICVPNIQSMQYTFGRQYWTYLDPIFHPFHYSVRGLSKMLQRAGFKIRKLFPYSLEYDLFGWHQTLLNRITESNNYLYMKKKKGIEIPSSVATRYVSAVHIFLLPLTLFANLITYCMNNPSCIDIVAYKRPVQNTIL